jgi:DNA-binding transcriptional LysR family regulator
MKHSDLPALSIFAAVCAAGGFRGAARTLGLSVSVVSHAVNGLEQRIGVRLLARSTRSVAPTEAGAGLLAQLAPALAAIGEAVEAASASQSHIAGTIRLSVPRAAAALVLVPLAVRFMQAFPAVSVEILVEDGFTDIVAAGFDAGVRFDESLQPDMVAFPIGAAQRGAIVAAPAYLARHPAPRTPAELGAHACIQRRFAGGSLYKWELAQGDELQEVAVSGPLVLNDDALAAQAAVGGAGLAYVFEAQVADELADGRLVAVMEDWWPRFPGFFLYYPSRKLMRPCLRAFMDFARDDKA